MIIAQLTDTHLKASGKLAYKKVDTAGCLREAIRHINEFTPQIDAVIFTGDLTDKGNPEEFAALKGILSKLKAPCYLVPGNHDQRENLLCAFADKDYLQACGTFVHYVVDNYPVRLIGLDTTVPGKPFGELCEERLTWLDHVLAMEPDKPTMLFQHHPPFQTGIGHMDVQSLLNADDFFEVLQRHKQVKHIACGHVHRDIFTQINGVGVSVAPNSAHSVTLCLKSDAPSNFMLEPATLRLFWIDEDVNIISHLHFLGEFEGPYPFFGPSGALVD